MPAQIADDDADAALDQGAGLVVEHRVVEARPWSKTTACSPLPASSYASCASPLSSRFVKFTTF
ncbi:hypothetical protein ACFONK_17195 [Microbacterium barkeri]|uniref:hypothetical protein n=1 Tax=Microbacterium barkeri TaxID=33917 RepID=UPI00360918CA